MKIAKNFAKMLIQRDLIRGVFVLCIFIFGGLFVPGQ